MIASFLLRNCYDVLLRSPPAVHFAAAELNMFITRYSSLATMWTGLWWSGLKVRRSDFESDTPS